MCCGASIGANATVVCGFTIGRRALVAEGAVLTKDVLDHALMGRVPSRIIGWVWEGGVPLNCYDGVDDSEECSRRYKTEQDRRIRRIGDATESHGVTRGTG